MVTATTDSYLSHIFEFRTILRRGVGVAELLIICRPNKFVETALVPTKFVGKAVPTNLLERHIGVPIENQ